MKPTPNFLQISNILKTSFLKLWTLFVLCSLLGSCKSIFINKKELHSFKIIKQLDYPYQEVVNQHVSKSLKDVLDNDQIKTLENFNNTAHFLENLLATECVGCSNSIGRLMPMYAIQKGKFIHFGFKNEMGIENWVFKKNGAFKTRFYSFQGESQEEIQQTLKTIQDIDYVLQGVYPVNIDNSSLYLEHVEFENPSVSNDQWYQHMFPTRIKYQVDLNEQRPVLRFKPEGGLYSFQKPDGNKTYQIINFVEPLFYVNPVGIGNTISYSSFTNAFYANATFFLMNLEDDAQVSIRIESKNTDDGFEFSVLDNDGFYTIEDYLQKEHPSFKQVKRKIKKGRYLIRILHENADYAENPLYTIYIDKEIVKSKQVININ